MGNIPNVYPYITIRLIKADQSKCLSTVGTRVTTGAKDCCLTSVLPHIGTVAAANSPAQ